MRVRLFRLWPGPQPLFVPVLGRQAVPGALMAAGCEALPRAKVEAGRKGEGSVASGQSLQQEGRAASGGVTSGVTSPCNRRCVLPSGGATAAWLHHMVPGWQLPIEFAHWSWCLCDGFNVLTGPGAFLMVLMCLVVMVPL